MKIRYYVVNKKHLYIAVIRDNPMIPPHTSTLLTSHYQSTHVSRAVTLLSRSLVWLVAHWGYGSDW